MKNAQKSTGGKKRRHQADPSAIYRVMSRVQPFTEEEMATLTVPVLTAWEKFRTGCGEYDDYCTLASAMNICIVRAESIDPVCVEAAKRAQDALVRIHDRHKNIGRWGVDGIALQDIPVAIDLYQQMLQLSTPIQIKAALRETLKRMDQGHTRL